MRTERERGRLGVRGAAVLGLAALLASVAAIAAFEVGRAHPGTASSASATASPFVALTPYGPSPLLGPTPTLTPALSPSPAATSLPRCPAETETFPVGFRAYHTYAGLCRTLVAAATAHPDLAKLFSIGRSFQGREIWAMWVVALAVRDRGLSAAVSSCEYESG